MKTTELYDWIIQETVEVSGIGRDRIEHGKDEESSDARVAVVWLLGRVLTDAQISLLMGITRRGVHYIRSSYEAKRGKWVVRSIVEAVRKRMGSEVLQGK